ncbi:MAG: thioredoxin family protein [Bacteroidales bacterium]|nr:thioredoxin family protein [Bacteroidales bacterium]
MEGIFNLQELQEIIENETAVLLYFSSDSCSVCKVLKPKVAELLQDRFPLMKVRYVNTELSPLISGQFRVFTIPTILICFEGKEQVRFSRNISIHQLEEAISRPYSMVFEEL